MHGAQSGDVSGRAPNQDARTEASLGPEASDALAAIVASSDDAIYSKDARAHITSWNGAAERLYGYSAEEAIGKPVAMLVPASRKSEEIDILRQILRGGHVEHYETQRVRKDREVVNVSISVSPLHNARGDIVEAAVIARDVTQQRRLEERIATERKAHLDAARKQALELNDEVVQGLAVAKMALETGRHEQGLEAVTSTLERAKGIVTNLLDRHMEGRPLLPGDLVRGSRNRSRR